jgi:hypothetical protein
VVVPSEGAKGVREAMVVAFPQAQDIGDRPPLTAQVDDMATALELEGPARHAWVSSQLDRCWAGEGAQVVATWQPPHEDAPKERLRQLIEHGTRWAESVDGGASHERGWP